MGGCDKGVKGGVIRVYKKKGGIWREYVTHLYATQMGVDCRQVVHGLQEVLPQHTHVFVGRGCG